MAQGGDGLLRHGSIVAAGAVATLGQAGPGAGGGDSLVCHDVVTQGGDGLLLLDDSITDRTLAAFSQAGLGAGGSLSGYRFRGMASGIDDFVLYCITTTASIMLVALIAASGVGLSVFDPIVTQGRGGHICDLHGIGTTACEVLIANFASPVRHITLLGAGSGVCRNILAGVGDHGKFLLFAVTATGAGRGLRTLGGAGGLNDSGREVVTQLIDRQRLHRRRDEISPFASEILITFLTVIVFRHAFLFTRCGDCGSLGHTIVLAHLGLYRSSGLRRTAFALGATIEIVGMVLSLLVVSARASNRVGTILVVCPSLLGTGVLAYLGLYRRSSGPLRAAFALGVTIEIVGMLLSLLVVSTRANNRVGAILVVCPSLLGTGVLAYLGLYRRSSGLRRAADFANVIHKGVLGDLHRCVAVEAVLAVGLPVDALYLVIALMHTRTIEGMSMTAKRAGAGLAVTFLTAAGLGTPVAVSVLLCSSKAAPGAGGRMGAGLVVGIVQLTIMVADRCPRNRLGTAGANAIHICVVLIRHDNLTTTTRNLVSTIAIVGIGLLGVYVLAMVISLNLHAADTVVDRYSGVGCIGRYALRTNGQVADALTGIIADSAMPPVKAFGRMLSIVMLPCSTLIVVLTLVAADFALARGVVVDMRSFFKLSSTALSSAVLPVGVGIMVPRSIGCMGNSRDFLLIYCVATISANIPRLSGCRTGRCLNLLRLMPV